MTLTKSTMLELGTKAPEFNLVDVLEFNLVDVFSGKLVTLSDFKYKKALLTVFMQ